MQQIRVLHVLKQMEIGGIQSFLMNVYNNLDVNKIQFDFLVTSKGPHDEEIIFNGGKIYYLTDFRIQGMYNYKRELKSFFLNHPEYSIIHIHYSQFTGIIAKIANECGIKVIISHSHSSSLSGNFFKKIYKKLLGPSINNNVTDYFACSNDASEFLFNKDSNKAHIIKNGIDIDKFKFNKKIRNEIREKYKISKSTTVVGHSGRFDSVKNHNFLIDVFCEYIKFNPNSVLLLIGDGEERKKIEQKVKKLGIASKVIFLGNTKESYKYYNAMDIFVFPSKFEGLGISLIEAQTNGLRCFASSSIPKETNVSNSIIFLSLEETKEKWAKTINEADIKRKNYTDLIIQKGYDINTTTKELTEFYLSKNRM